MHVRMLRQRRVPRCTAGRDVRGGASLTRSASFMVLAPLRRVLCSSAFLFPLRSTCQAQHPPPAAPCLARSRRAGGVHHAFLRVACCSHEPAQRVCACARVCPWMDAAADVAGAALGRHLL
jgi:hypothetical protein